jgi:hypothetical protein
MIDIISSPYTDAEKELVKAVVKSIRTNVLLILVVWLKGIKILV